MDVTRNARSSQVAAALGLSAASVQAYARAGRIPFRLTPGGQYRFSVEEVVSLLARPVIEVRHDLVDLRTSSSRVIVDGQSAYREPSFDEVTTSRLRARGLHERPRPTAASIRPTDGLAELDHLITRADGAALAVLHR